MQPCGNAPPLDDELEDEDVTPLLEDELEALLDDDVEDEVDEEDEGLEEEDDDDVPPQATKATNTALKKLARKISIKLPGN